LIADVLSLVPAGHALSPSTNDLIYWQSVFHGDGSTIAANVTRSDMTAEVKHSVSIFTLDAIRDDALYLRAPKSRQRQLNLPNGTKQKITMKKTKTKITRCSEETVQS